MDAKKQNDDENVGMGTRPEDTSCWGRYCRRKGYHAAGQETHLQISRLTIKMEEKYFETYSGEVHDDFWV